jgi:flagella synthesis protein FlgN
MALATTPPSTDLLRIIAEEAASVEQFVALLKLEQASLSHGSSAELLLFAEQKTSLASELNGYAEQRNRSLATQGFAADRAGVEAWCMAQGLETTAADTWQRILDRAAEAHELNRLNGELIQMRMQYNAKALEALSGSKNTLDLYGPDGQRATLSNRRINDAA